MVPSSPPQTFVNFINKILWKAIADKVGDKYFPTTSLDVAC